MARSRTVEALRPPAAAMMDQSRLETGIRQALAKVVTSFLTRPIPTLFMVAALTANCFAMTGVPASPKTSHRKQYATLVTHIRRSALRGLLHWRFLRKIHTSFISARNTCLRAAIAEI